MGRRLKVGQVGTVNVRRNDNGTWTATTRVRNLSDRVETVQRTAATKKLADDSVRTAAREKVFSGTPGAIHAEMTLLELVDKTLTALRTDQAGRGNQIQSVNMLERHVKFLRGHGGYPEIGNLRLSDCTPAVIQHWLENISGTVPGSARQLKVLLAHAFDLALRYGVELWTRNPAATARLRTSTPSTPQALTQEEIDAVWQAVLDWEAHPRRTTDLSGIVGLLIATGCRPGESVALLWEDINLESSPPTVTIRATAVRQDGKLLRQPCPKTDAGYRTLALPDWYADMLRHRYEHRSPEATFVFPNDVGGMYEPNNVWMKFRQARGDKLAHIMPKSFRYTVATRLEATVGAEAAARQLGHRSPTVTHRYYIAKPAVAGDFRDVLSGLEPGRESGG